MNSRPSVIAKDAEAPADAELVRRAKTMDEEAVSALFKKSFPKVYNYYMSRLREPQAAEDATSEVMVRMIEALPKYRVSKVPFEAWVFRIAKNRFIDMVRRKERRREQSADVTEWYGRSDSEFDRILDRESIDYALEYLTEVQRKVIIMRFIEGHDVETVAAAIGRSGQATKSLQFRALTSMRRVLEERKNGVHSGRTNGRMPLEFATPG